jgi:hypothetical protein
VVSQSPGLVKALQEEGEGSHTFMDNTLETCTIIVVSKYRRHGNIAKMDLDV